MPLYSTHQEFNLQTEFPNKRRALSAAPQNEATNRNQVKMHMKEVCEETIKQLELLEYATPYILIVVIYCCFEKANAKFFKF